MNPQHVIEVSVEVLADRGHVLSNVQAQGRAAGGASLWSALLGAILSTK